MTLTFTTTCNDPAKCRTPMMGDNGQRLDEPEWTDSWIDPEGRQYLVEVGAHAHVVRCHTIMVNHNLTVDTLERMGWIHFSLDFTFPVANETIAFTQSQLTTMFGVYVKGLNTDNNSGHHLAQLDFVKKCIDREGK